MGLCTINSMFLTSRYFPNFKYVQIIKYIFFINEKKYFVGARIRLKIYASSV